MTEDDEENLGQLGEVSVPPPPVRPSRDVEDAPPVLPSRPRGKSASMVRPTPQLGMAFSSPGLLQFGPKKLIWSSARSVG